jgi:hypothetical protein
VSASANGPVARWIVEENQRPGSGDWQAGDYTSRAGAIEAYANVVSAQQGDTVTLFVSTDEPSYRVEAYRMGWYQGLGGRLVWQSDGQAGRVQPPASVTPGINMAEARWEPSVQVAIDASFPPGVYLFRLVTPTGHTTRVPLTIRDDSSTAAYLVQNSVTSWQAYNPWGQYSLYFGPGNSFPRRARIVSFDRPYALGGGSSEYLGLEHPLVMLMEQLGLDVTYVTDVDTHADPARLLSHRAFFSLGHDEYWSKEMRDGVESARDHGVNLAILGANAAFRQIRYEPSALGANRHEVCYKSAAEDPMRRVNPALTTVNWRDPPVSRPESQFIGQQYESNPVRADMVIADPTAWVFAGSNATLGQHLDTVVGSEYDRFLPTQAGPPNVQVLAHSPVVCHGRKSVANMTYYSAPSGAGVFSTGTIFWITKLTPAAMSPALYDPVVSQVTKNVLAAFGNGPAGTAHPSQANYQEVVARLGTATGATPQESA